MGEPGTIYFSGEEIDQLSEYLKLEKTEMLEKYFHPFRDSYTARDDCEDGKCIFYDNGCSIYPVRPSQCRAYPFWRFMLRSKETWDEYAQSCPGMNQGKYYSAEEISQIASKSSI